MAEKMSDAELRKELILLGEKSIGPITDTTRPLYIKKLNRLKDEKKKQKATDVKRTQSNRTVTKKLLGFSSDESDGENAGKVIEKHTDIVKTRSRNNRGRSARSATTNKTSVKANENSNSSLTRPSLRPRHSVRQQNQSVNENATSSKGTYYSNRYNTENTYTEEGPSMHSAVIQASFNSTLNSTRDLKENQHSKRHNNRYFKSEFSDSDLDEEDEEDQSFGEGLDFTQTNGDESWDEPEMVSHSVNTSPGLDRSSILNPSSRNTSGYVLKSSKISRTRDGKLPKLSPERYYDQAGVMGTDGFKAKEITTSYKLPHYISLFLVILALLFFAVITVVYVNMHSARREDSQVKNNMICSSSNEVTQKECIQKDMYDRAFHLVKFLSSTLRKQAGRHECGYTSDGRRLTYDQIKTDLVNKYGTSHSFQQQETFNDAIKLILANPSWQIRMFDNSGEETKELDKLFSLESQLAEKDVYCRLLQSISSVFNLLLYLCLGALVVMTVLAILKYKWQKHEKEKQQVYDLVEKIIDILKEHSENCQQDKDLDNYLAIPHVRDMLIPLKERKKKQAIWDKAVKVLSANESRVRVETQFVQGEEFAVWRWIQTRACSNGGKVWQGQAFGESKDAKSPFPNFTPLPCLKIRNMFNADTEYLKDWHVKVQDAIIEKCGSNHGIVHIAVDKSSKEGCVYVKCNSPTTAGDCFSALHGWWFDGKLVTVKFLRPERYHERFPESNHCSRALRPSDDQLSSLAQPFHRSFLEEY